MCAGVRACTAYIVAVSEFASVMQVLVLAVLVLPVALVLRAVLVLLSKH